MIPFDESAIMAFFGEYVYRPEYVYGFLTIFMLASSFGFPIPEEVVLISAGLVANASLHPETFPPPFPGAEGVNIWVLCVVAFFAVFGSDVIVYLLGRVFGSKIIKTKFFQKQVAGKGFDTINSWFQKYGAFACGVFRFTPGIRFPGHLSCGLLGIPLWKFCLVDGFAALVSVPTQIYFVGTYGGVILKKIAEFKIYVAYAAAALLVVWLIRKIYLKNVRKPIS